MIPVDAKVSQDNDETMEVDPIQATLKTVAAQGTGESDVITIDD